jgi:glycosyltransferase involved in cell wall biosynthesis
MRILVHDYSGHPFQVQLSRALAACGHTVHHRYASFFQTPKGPLAPAAGDPPSFDIAGLDIGAESAKCSFVKRVRQEIAYGHVMVREVARLEPEIVISSNMPLDPQAILARECRARRIRFAVWLQHIYAVAIDRILRRRLPLMGTAIGARYLRLEKRILREADAIVAITADFLPILQSWGVARDKIEVIENWAPIEDMPTRPRHNAWSAAHGLDGRLVFLYSGTLGLRHNPSLLLALANRRPDARMVVVSEGPGADWLAARKTENLILLPFQPFDGMPDALASADVLTAVLEADAGVFSVPSKVLTYLCAGRPILAAMPGENLAARTLLRARAGVVVGPGEEHGFCEAAERLAADADLRERMGRAARAHAEAHFRIGDIAARFERLCQKVKADYV